MEPPEPKPLDGLSLVLGAAARALFPLNLYHFFFTGRLRLLLLFHASLPGPLQVLLVV